MSAKCTNEKKSYSNYHTILRKKTKYFNDVANSYEFIRTHSYNFVRFAFATGAFDFASGMGLQSRLFSSNC